MYVAYYILKHKLVGDAQEAYYKQVLDSWKKLKFNGWYGCSGGDYSDKVGVIGSSPILPTS